MDNKKINHLYINKPGDYYDAQMNSKTLRSLWFRRRQFITGRLVKKYSKAGLILDIGCGNCLWNRESMHIVGIDICENMLRYNMQIMPSFFPLKADIRGGLPIKSESVDTIVVTEVLEHFSGYRLLTEEIKRVLKKNGVVIVSIPYTEFPGLWGLLFPVWCKYKGLMDNDEFYLNRCGHTADIDIKKLRRAFNGFILLEQIAMNLLTVFFVEKKK